VRVNKRRNIVVVLNLWLVFLGERKGEEHLISAMNNAYVPELQLMHLYPLTGFLGIFRHIQFAAINATSFSFFFPSIHSSFLNILILFINNTVSWACKRFSSVT